MLTKVTDRLVSLVRDLAAIVLLLGLVLNFCNVVGRYFFNAPIEWAEEVMLFMMVAIVFLGASYVSWRGRQIAMDLIILMLPTRLKKIVVTFVLCFEVVVPLIIVYLGAPVVIQLWNFDQRTEASDIPLAIPQSLVPIGLFLVAIVTIIRIIVSLSNVTGAAPTPPESKLAVLR
jgi:C4-dicarboxylate transporter DctQ subunit